MPRLAELCGRTLGTGKYKDGVLKTAHVLHTFTVGVKLAVLGVANNTKT